MAGGAAAAGPSGPAAGPARSVCLLGGSGFVGSRLAARLAATGRRVIIPTRQAARAAHLRVLPTAKVTVADIHDPATLARLVAGCDTLVNLVGILNERGRDGRGFARAHSGLVQHIVKAMPPVRAPKLVQLSALNADAAGPSHYLRTKGEAEAIIRASPGLRWTILQPSVIFGPGDSFTNRFANLIALLPGLFPLAMAEARFAPVYLDDVVAALEQAIDNPATDGQSYQLCGPEIFRLGEIVELIAHALGRRRLIIGLPRPLSRLQAALMDFVPGKPFSTDNYHSLLVPSVCSDDGFQRLGIRPQPFTRLLSHSLDRLRAHGPLDDYRRSAGRAREDRDSGDRRG